jgi:AcrR family transcriptional regulator
MSSPVGDVDIPGIRTPRQARSRETFERILRTGAEVLADRGYEGFSLSELCRRAEVSFGALYTRIESKEALVLAIHDRELTRISRETEIFEAPELWAALPTRTFVLDAVRALGMHYDRNRRLLRVFIQRASVDLTMREHGQRFNAQLAARFTGLLRRRAAEIPHPEPNRAVDAAYQMAAASFGWRTAFGPTFTSELNTEPDAFIDQVANAVAGYLLHAPDTSHPPNRPRLSDASAPQR